MKSNEQAPLYFSTPEKPSASGASKDQKSPYLKSVLSGSLLQTSRVVREAISDRLAAIRYIKESQWRHHAMRG